MMGVWISSLSEYELAEYELNNFFVGLLSTDDLLWVSEYNLNIINGCLDIIMDIISLDIINGCLNIIILLYACELILKLKMGSEYELEYELNNFFCGFVKYGWFIVGACIITLNIIIQWRKFF